MSLIQADRTPAGALARPFPQVPGVTHRFVTVRGIKLHVAEAGAAAGETVLLLRIPRALVRLAPRHPAAG